MGGAGVTPRGIHRDRTRQAIGRANVDLCRELAITVITEAVEAMDEVTTLRRLDGALMHGFLFAQPGIEATLAAQ